MPVEEHEEGRRLGRLLREELDLLQRVLALKGEVQQRPLLQHPEEEQ